MLTIDLFNYQVSKENREKVKILVYEKLEKYFNILPIEIDVLNYDDSEFISAYLEKSQIYNNQIIVDINILNHYIFPFTFFITILKVLKAH